MRQLLNHGQESGYHHIHIGFNGRLDSMQAAVLIEKLNIFAKEVDLRNDVAKKYREAFAGKIKMQEIPEGHISSWAQFTIEVNNRDSFRESLSKENVPTAVHYPAQLTDQPIYKEFSHVDTPASKSAASKVVSLPMHPYLKDEDQKIVIESVLKNFKD